jgi:ABC-type Mn2+/Zn2+ transport system ATPase subunit
LTPEAHRPPVISCRGLTVRYGREEVLAGVDLEVAAGAFLPLVGPNGAGKTTLLRAILGLVKPSAGSVRTPFARRPPGYVPQQGVIDPLFPVSAAGIVAMGLYPAVGWRRRPGRREAQTVEEALARLGLLAHGHKSFAELSGGMRQKVLLARALVSAPEVMILDEPTAGLDRGSQEEILRHLSRLNRREGRTVVMAHHGEALLTGLAQEVCQVEHGRVRFRRLDRDR